ncbi:tripartite tricarboxylate transporter TctB family protein [Ruegeria sp. 2012CJ41-6]|uniref:Tripartite tricarboxylate transporter TctB family protein n=1 Tax=Ruegeria spongiae TaxID=2942209 RepID=A0ABT0Q708_9RHOB|nr:tripartite tricarboxylate transporter TctB family protein [Ruegeria spongiae]MCL6285600.1 tripartite tricarboxylate transporter TctB family protein [Ruegeria spongiae]
MVALALIISAAIVLLFVIPGQTTEGFEGEFSQAVMPYAAATLILLSSVALLFRSIHSLRVGYAPPTEGEVLEVPADRVFWAVCGLGVAIFVVALIVLDTVGFILGGAALIAAVGLAFNHRKAIWIAVLALLFPSVMALLIRYGLGLVLP